VPTSADSILIPLVANQPSLSALTAAGKLTIASGAVVSLGSSTFPAGQRFSSGGATLNWTP